MNCQAKFWIRCAAVLGGLAVVMGAFAAHGLDKELVKIYEGETRTVLGEQIPAAQKYLKDFTTAAEYQMTHSLAMLAVGILAAISPVRRRSLTVAGGSFLIGILLFSGSLYVLTMTKMTKLGMITPFGGLAFIVGWAALLFCCCQCSTGEAKAGTKPEVTA